MYWFLCVLVFVILIGFTYLLKRKWKYPFIALGLSLFITGSTIAIDYYAQTMATEVWSGRVEDWSHREEWDEWHPPVTTCSNDSKGRSQCTTTAGYWEHHYAENYIYTTDDGWVSVGQSPDGKTFNDRWPNKADELIPFWPKGTPSASVHTYVNKVKASYSIFKHKEIDLNEYSDLPKYPQSIQSYINVDRIVGDVPNKQQALKVLADKNSELNKFVPDPEDSRKKRSWKQVNIIFVNVGVNKGEDYGYALQDSWQGGNKNDFVVSFSVDEKGNYLWVYPFSWSEVEILKLEVRDYMMNLKSVNDFVPVVEMVYQLVAEKFERKQFADFNYLQIELSNVASFILVFLNTVMCIVMMWVSFNDPIHRRMHRRNRF